MGGKVKGYTLIEVAVVLAIISILMGLSVRYLILPYRLIQIDLVIFRGCECKTTLSAPIPQEAFLG